MKSIETVEVVAPATWASYFINGDASGLEDAEIAAADRWLERESKGCEFFDIVDCGEAYFGRWFDDWGQPGVTGGDLVEYTALYRETKS